MGQEWLSRRKAMAMRLQAHIYQREKKPSQAIGSFLRAAEMLEKLVNPDVADRTNALLNRALASETSAARCLRNRPAPDLRGAYEGFGVAAIYAKREERLNRVSGKSANPRFRWYLRYWQHVSAIGLFSLEADFSFACKHVDVAAKYAAKMPNFFTQKWYVSIQDLQNQKFIVYACEAFIVSTDIQRAQQLLQKWLELGSDIQGTERFMRIKLRKLALDVLLGIQSKGNQSKQSAVELEKLVRSCRSFGLIEMHIMEVIRALMSSQIGFDTAASRIKQVFILDSPPPKGQVYLDLTTESEKSFRQLPRLFQEWLQDYQDNSEKVLYIFL